MSEIPQLVRVIDAKQSGSTVEFYVEFIKLNENQPRMTIRVHENFLWLLESLQSQPNIGGIILPPLPSSPTPSLLKVDVPTQATMMEQTGISLFDFQEFCVGYEKFLNVCLAHPRLGKLRIFEKFLFDKEIPNAIKPKRNIFGGITKLMEDIRAFTLEEADEDFQYFAEQANEYSKLAKDSKNAFHALVDSEYKLAKSFEVLYYYVKATKKLENTPPNMNMWLEMLLRGLQYSSNLRIMIAKNRQRTLGAALVFNAGFLESFQEWLRKRNMKALDVINIQTTFDNASPKKQEKIVDEVKQLRKEYLEINAMAKPEIARFHRQRIFTLKDSMKELAESEIQIAQASIIALKKMYEEASSLPA